MLARVAVLLLLCCAFAAAAVAVDDDDEFEGVAAAVPQPAHTTRAAQSQSAPAPTAPPAYRPTTLADRLRPWVSEIVFAALVLAFAANYYFGSLANKERARAWARVMKPVFEEQFSRVDTLRRVSPHEFLLYCTGRTNCIAAEVRLNMLARQDLASLALSLFTASSDTMTIDVPLADSLAPVVLAICPAGKEKKWRGEYDELKFTKLRNFSSSSSSSSVVSRSKLVFMSDSAELGQILAPELLSALDTLAPALQLAYVSDCYAAPRCEYRCMARFVFSLAAVSDASANALGPLAVRTALRLVDVLSAFAPSAAALERARKKRAQLKSKETHDELSQRAERLKEEKLLREQEAISKLTGAERARAEEKVRKREAKQAAKRKAGRVKIMKG